MFRSPLNKLALAMVTCLLFSNTLYAIETNLLNDPKIIKALQEDEIEIVKIEKIYTDVNISKSKKNYTIVVAKARIPKAKYID